MLVTVKIDLYNLEELIGFLRDSLAIANDAPVPVLAAPVAALQTDYDALDEAYKVSQASAFTGSIAEEDDERDASFIGIRKYCEAHRYHYDLTLKETAEVLLKNIKLYGTQLYKLGYQAQTTVLDNLIRDWETKPELVSAVATLSLGNWLAHLKAKNANVKDLLLDRVREEAARIITNTIEQRKAVVVAYRNLEKHITYNDFLNPSPELSTFGQKLNTLIEQYNQVYERRLSLARQQTQQ